MMNWWKLTLPAVLALFLCIAVSAHAASITVTQASTRVTVSLTGPISKDAFVKFQKQAGQLQSTRNRPVVVILKSGGGWVDPGLQIGRFIHKHHFATAVLDNAYCSSSCALIWLAGTPRYKQPNGKVGFHQVFVVSEKKRKVFVQGNAVVGAYLNSIGLSVKVVRYVTQARPNTMKWLTPADAKRIGLAVQPLPTG